MQNKARKQRTYPPRTVISNTKTPKIDKIEYLRTIEELGGSPEGLQVFMNTKITEAVQVAGGEAGAIGRQVLRQFWRSSTRITNLWLVILELYKLNLIHQIQR